MVTAAGSGIGRETALLCARLGAALALCDLDEEGLQSTARAANALGAEVLIERLDVADAERMGVFAARVHERFDTVELLVNNTDMGVIATFLDTELSDWRHLMVTPGFVDIHTHYDGQATWDSRLQPSSWHGVTTAVMGNCGVGFAPVRVADRQRLIELMEGVEDIPGAALDEGLNWSWESFGQYLDALEARLGYLLSRVAPPLSRWTAARLARLAG